MTVIDRKQLKVHHEGFWLAWDFFMLALLVLNLALIIFDTLYSTLAVQNLLTQWIPGLVEAYAPVHANFALVDLGFISVFLFEFFLRWLIAIRRKEYLRWYFFPFIHWYDLIGCIPVAGARIFRFLRIFAILYRLQTAGVIDLTQTRVFSFFRFYYNVFLEELSDRIVIKVLSDMQGELSHGAPLVRQIREEVLAPRRPDLYRWISHLLQHAGRVIDAEESGQAFNGHVRESVRRAIRESEDIRRYARLPVIGDTIEQTLEGAVTDVVVQSLVHLLRDFSPERIGGLAERIRAQAPATEEELVLDKAVVKLVEESLELVKEHVAVQRWKEHLETRL